MRIWNCAIPDNIIIPQNEKSLTRRRQLNMVFAKSFCYWISLCFGSMWILLSVVPSYHHHIHTHWAFGNMMESPFVGESRHDIPFYPSYCWLNMVKSPSNIPLVWPDSHWSVESSFFHGIHGGPHWYDPWLKYMGFLVTDFTDFTALEHPWHDFFSGTMDVKQTENLRGIHRWSHDTKNHMDSEGSSTSWLIFLDIFYDRVVCCPLTKRSTNRCWKLIDAAWTVDCSPNQPLNRDQVKGWLQKFTSKWHVQLW